MDYVHGGEGLLMAPAYAMPRMLAREGLKLQDFDFYEIHEAFASQVLATLKVWDDPVFCSASVSTSTGHDRPVQAQRRRLLACRGAPFAATGGGSWRPSPSCWREGGGRGVISICAAGGQGVTAILER